MWVVQLEEEKWRRPFKIFFSGLPLKNDTWFSFLQTTREKSGKVTFDSFLRRRRHHRNIADFFPVVKLITRTFLAGKFKPFFYDISRSSNQLCFLQANSAILTYGAPKAMFFGWCTRSIFFLLPAKLDSVSWLKGAICDDEQDGTWVVAWPPTNLPSLASNRIKIFASKW